MGLHRNLEPIRGTGLRSREHRFESCQGTVSDGLGREIRLLPLGGFLRNLDRFGSTPGA